MDVFCAPFIFINIFFLNQVWSAETDETTTNPTNVEETTAFKVELFPSNPVHPGQTRRPRKFFGKIHSGAAFLTGLKLGSVLSKKGFELGHGKIVSTHSFQMFGKPINSAMSLSYGNSVPLLPLADDEPMAAEGDETKKKTSLKNDENIYHVTVIENHSPQADETFQSVCAEINKDQGNAINEKFDAISNDDLRTLEESEQKKLKTEEEAFLEEHNNVVKEFNKNLVRRTNSRFKSK